MALSLGFTIISEMSSTLSEKELKAEVAAFCAEMQPKKRAFFNLQSNLYRTVSGSTGKSGRYTDAKIGDSTPPQELLGRVQSAGKPMFKTNSRGLRIYTSKVPPPPEINPVPPRPAGHNQRLETFDFSTWETEQYAALEQIKKEHESIDSWLTKVATKRPPWCERGFLAPRPPSGGTEQLSTKWRCRSSRAGSVSADV